MCRSADQERISRLKARTAELEQENAELLRAAERRLTGGGSRKGGGGRSEQQQVNSRVLTYSGLLLCVRDALERSQQQQPFSVAGEALSVSPSPVSPAVTTPDFRGLASASSVGYYC